jgi:predicted SnoaL-like aldol condensation-catalyzing enzyme
MVTKERAVEFLRLASAGKVEEAFARFVAPEFRHHNQYFPGDRASLERAMLEAARASPNKSLTVKYCYQDGNTVVTHSLVERASLQVPAIAVVHIFRFEGDRIAELWDVGQPIQADSPNTNGMF